MLTLRWRGFAEKTVRQNIEVVCDKWRFECGDVYVEAGSYGFFELTAAEPPPETVPRSLAVESVRISAANDGPEERAGLRLEDLELISWSR